MRITKRQLKRIIREVNPDGTISAGEDEERADLLATVEMRIDELIQHAISEAERIGGGFRSPGIKRECKMLMLEKIQRMR